jgi:hypothetical protein
VIGDRDALIACAWADDGTPMLCDEPKLRFAAAERDEKIGLDVTELRRRAAAIAAVHLAEQTLRERQR